MAGVKIDVMSFQNQVLASGRTDARRHAWSSTRARSRSR